MQNQPNQTSELQINLAKFEELAEVFINKQESGCEEYPGSAYDNSERWISAFKEFIFSEELIQQKRKEEYFKLKEQLESMKAEFEPELVKEEKPICIQDMHGDFYEASKDVRIGSCEGCAFECNTDACDDACLDYNCLGAEIIWIKIKN